MVNLVKNSPGKSACSSLNDFSLIGIFAAHMAQVIQEWIKQNLWKTAFKKFEAMADHIFSNSLKAVFHKFYLVHS